MHEESRKDQNKNKKELLDYVGKSRNEFREHTQTHPNRVYLITVIRKSSLCTPKKKKEKKRKRKKRKRRYNMYIPKILTSSRKAIETRSQYLPVFQLHFAHVVHLYDLQMKINLNNTH